MESTKVDSNAISNLISEITDVLDASDQQGSVQETAMTLPHQLQQKQSPLRPSLAAGYCHESTAPGQPQAPPQPARRTASHRKLAPGGHSLKKIARLLPAQRAQLERELAEVRVAWERYRSTNSRDAVYGYLLAVFSLVTRWQGQNCAMKNSLAALQLKPHAPDMRPEPFARIIFCTCDPEIADAKTRSKWSRVLRFARKEKPIAQSLTEFIKGNGGLNKCARRFSRGV